MFIPDYKAIRVTRFQNLCAFWVSKTPQGECFTEFRAGSLVASSRIHSSSDSFVFASVSRSVFAGCRIIWPISSALGLISAVLSLALCQLNEFRKISAGI